MYVYIYIFRYIYYDIGKALTHECVYFVYFIRQENPCFSILCIHTYECYVYYCPEQFNRVMCFCCLLATFMSQLRKQQKQQNIGITERSMTTQKKNTLIKSLTFYNLHIIRYMRLVANQKLVSFLLSSNTNLDDNSIVFFFLSLSLSLLLQYSKLFVYSSLHFIHGA